jgi:hypothetical protein
MVAPVLQSARLQALFALQSRVTRNRRNSAKCRTQTVPHFAKLWELLAAVAPVPAIQRNAGQALRFSDKQISVECKRRGDAEA